MSPAWIALIAAGLFEVGFTTCMRFIDGLSRPLAIAGFIACLTLSFLLLIKATQTIPLGTAYAVWTGIGAAGTATLGILVFKEPATTLRLVFLAMLIGSIIGLKLVSGND
jgi:quaternary ammonium compound-resistance protein SugE